jgi:hypothetical protein
MRHIRQRYDNDCGIATAAMAARLSYIQAKNATPKQHQNGMTSRRLRNILASVSNHVWVEKRMKGKLPRLAEFYYSGEAVLMIYNPYNKKKLKCHYAFVKNGIYYDPDLDAPVKLRSKKLKKWNHWRVWLVITKDLQKSRPSRRR